MESLPQGLPTNFMYVHKFKGCVGALDDLVCRLTLCILKQII